MRVGAVLSSPVTGMNDSRDTLYTRPMAEPAAFTFDDEVARVFPDMIRRSVPGYASIIVMTEILAGRYAHRGQQSLRSRLLSGRFDPGHVPGFEVPRLHHSRSG